VPVLLRHPDQLGHRLQRQFGGDVDQSQSRLASAASTIPTARPRRSDSMRCSTRGATLGVSRRRNCACRGSSIMFSRTPVEDASASGEINRIAEQLDLAVQIDGIGESD
jgi:hypothetical protein